MRKKAAKGSQHFTPCNNHSSLDAQQIVIQNRVARLPLCFFKSLSRCSVSPHHYHFHQSWSFKCQERQNNFLKRVCVCVLSRSCLLCTERNFFPSQSHGTEEPHDDLLFTRSKSMLFQDCLQTPASFLSNLFLLDIVQTSSVKIFTSIKIFATLVSREFK